METAVDAGRRSASGNGGDLLQTPDVSHRPETDALCTWLPSASRGEGSARLLVCSSTVVVLVLVSWKEGKTARSRNTASHDVRPALPARSVMPSVWHRPWSLGLGS